MAVHFKFKSARDFDSIAIEGHCISVANLKEGILQKLCLGTTADFDLVISNVDTSEEYTDEDFLVQENTSVLVRRIPRCATSADDGRDAGDHTSTDVLPSDSEMDAQPEEQQPHLKDDEDARIKNFVDSSALDWMRQTQEASRRGNPSSSIRNNLAGQHRATPHEGYICHRCGVSGHFIQHCPTNGDPSYNVKKFKAPMGIPRTMLVSDPEGLYALPNGDVAKLQPNEDAFAKEISGAPAASEIPSELRCPICHNALKDAMLTTRCCFTSFCDSCIRNTLLSKSTCVCGKTARADDLVPNKTLREAVERFISGPASKDDIVSAAMDEDPKPPPNVEERPLSVREESPPDEEGDKGGSDELDVEEQLDYEGFDAEDLNMEEMEAIMEAEKEPQPDSPVREAAAAAAAADEQNKDDHKETSPEKGPSEVPEPDSNPEPESASRKPETAGPPNVWKKPGNPNHGPYAVEYTGYWQASQMMGVNYRVPYGYKTFVPFPSSVHPPFHPFVRRPDFHTFKRKREWKNPRTAGGNLKYEAPTKVEGPRNTASIEQRRNSALRGKPAEVSARAESPPQRRPSPPRYEGSPSPDRHPRRRSSPLQHQNGTSRRRSPSPVPRFQGGSASYSRSRSPKRELRKPSPRGVLENVEPFEKGDMHPRERRYPVENHRREYQNGPSRGEELRPRPPFRPAEFFREPPPKRPIRGPEYGPRRAPPRGEVMPDGRGRPRNLTDYHGSRPSFRGSDGEFLDEEVYYSRRLPPEWRPRQPDRRPLPPEGGPRRPPFRRKMMDSDIGPDTRPWRVQDDAWLRSDDDEYYGYLGRGPSMEEMEEYEDVLPGPRPRPLLRRRPRLRVSMQAEPGYEDAYGEVVNEQEELRDYEMEADGAYPPRRIVSEVLPVRARLQAPPVKARLWPPEAGRKRTAVYFSDGEEGLQQQAQKRVKVGGAKPWAVNDRGDNRGMGRSVFDRISFGGTEHSNARISFGATEHGNAAGRMVYLDDLY